MVETNLLIHELQLGQQLSQCVQSNRRADFGLMLAMLAEDVREHSQFKLPHDEITEPAYTDTKLRKFFQLPDEIPLGLQELDALNQYDQADLIDGNNLPTMHLQNALSPKALAFRDNKAHVPTQVMENTSLHCQNRNKDEQNKLLNNRNDFNAKLWLKTIQDSIVKSYIA